MHNTKSRLCEDKDENVKHMIREYSKLVQKTRHDWVGKMIYWELCKRLKFGQTSKWYMHKP